MSERSKEASAGSSPHTRGAPLPWRATGLVAGIIPAYAGSTMVDALAGLPAWDHPRIRGEHRPPSLMSLS